MHTVFASLSFTCKCSGIVIKGLNPLQNNHPQFKLYYSGGGMYWHGKWSNVQLTEAITNKNKNGHTCEIKE